MRQLNYLLYSRNRTDPVKIVRPRLLHLDVFLRHQEDSLFSQHGLLNGFHRAFPADIKMYHHIGKNGHPAKCHYR